MISQVKNQDIDLWEVWIEYDQFHVKNFGTLHVVGEILVDHSTTQPTIIKSEKGKKKQLVLQIPERPVGRCRMTEVYYTEPIEDLNQYASIVIYAGNKMVALFDEIEVMI